MCASELAYVGLQGENCILMHNYYCIYKILPRNMSQPAPQHLSQPTYAIHVASSLYKPLPQCVFSLAFQPKSKHEHRNLLLLSKSYFWRDFTRKTCVNNACSTSESRRHPLSKNIISFAIWQFVWHWGALSQPKLAPTNPSLPYTRIASLYNISVSFVALPNR